MKRETLSKLWVEKEGKRMSRRREHWWLEDGGRGNEPRKAGTSRNQERPGKTKKTFSKVSGKEVSPSHTFVLASETHISLPPSRSAP